MLFLTLSITVNTSTSGPENAFPLVNRGNDSKGPAHCCANTLVDFYFGGEYSQLINLFSPTGRQLAYEEEEEGGWAGDTRQFSSAS